MTTNTTINSSQPNLLYGIGIAILMMVSLITSNIPDLALSAYYELPYRKEICSALFLLGAALGTLAVSKHLKRADYPWKVPQSQVSYLYAGFFLAMLAAIIFAK